jgi:serine/threonine-protein kinase
VSLPSAARKPDDTVPSEPRTLVCPRCRKKWPEKEAPPACPVDGLGLVRPRDLVEVPDRDDPMVGRTLEGRYTILSKLGAGSMGTVYRAKQHAMGREVAIKILRGDRAVDESAKARFMREARANSLLASPNTVTVFDFGQSESGEFYLAMELLEGESLGQRIARVGRMSAPLAVDAARQALRSLGEAHAKGIIHRDLKPDNLFFARVLTSASPSGNGDDQAHDEIVKVLDFGIAKMINPDDPNPMNVVETQAGTVFGTPRYMSPEQAQGKPLDARSDLYSLAVILYQMLTGRPPFTDNDAVVVMARHIKSVPKRPNEACPEALVPKELEDVVMRTLSKDPKDRPASAEIFAGELLAALEAQGALTSGVRASITNAAGIPIPDSMRPPAVPLPKARKKFPLLLVAAPLVVLAAAVGVYFGMARGAKPGASASASTSTSTVPSASMGASTSTSVSATAEPPTVTPDSLPKARPPVTAASGKHVKAPPPPPAGKGKPVPTKPPGASPPTSTATPPGYGILGD